MTPIFSIARNAFLEAIRQPIFIVLVLIGLLAMVCNVNLAAFTMGEDEKLLVDLGLSTLLIVGLLLAAFTASSVLSKEIENKTVLTVVSKPVTRAAVIVGKFLGVAVALAVGYYVLLLSFLMAVRHKPQMGMGRGEIYDGPVLTFGLLFGLLALLTAGLLNYLYRRPFPSTLTACLAVMLTVAVGICSILARDWWLQSPLTDFNPQLLYAIGMVFLAILVLSAVAIAASTRVNQVITLLICCGVFLFGLVSEFFLGRSLADSASPLVRLLAPVYVAVPNLQVFWAAEALAQGNAITPEYFLSVAAYAAILITGLLALAVLLFQRRDVG
jgi:ABC-type transport system involved in multi-copper enzyme maturation permease subunit